MVQAVSSEAILKATGKPWEDWLEFFDSIDASSLTHKEIARRTHEDGGATSWWAQMLTVAYEQHIGRRIPGQDCEGEFSVSVSKTLNSDMDAALKWWLDAVGEQREFSDISVSRGQDVSKTDKWRYWRVGLADGSSVTVHIYEKSSDKSSLAIMHEKLESTEQVGHWRAYWKEFLKKASNKKTGMPSSTPGYSG